MTLNIFAGFILVVVMSLLARTSVSWLNGLVPLFPTFALIGQTSAYMIEGEIKAKEIALIGLFSIVPYAAYLLSVFFFTDIVGFPKAAGIGVLIWLVFAGIIVLFKMKAVSA